MLYSRQMSAITLTIPDELAERLRNHQERLPEILELGLRELHAGSPEGFEGAAEVLEFLAGLPSPEAILSLKPSERFERQMRDLLRRRGQFLGIHPYRIDRRADRQRLAIAISNHAAVRRDGGHA